MDANKLVAFAILMEGSGGILSKSPVYIQEKFKSVRLCSENWQLEQLLDRQNKAKLRKWLSTWSLSDRIAGTPAPNHKEEWKDFQEFLY